uniref:Secreted protein n=1 Tax=Trichogramma kaykai TaxID=54128 RepID=A0ABD2VSX3_9HYME
MRSTPRIAVLTSAMMKVHSSGLRNSRLRVSFLSPNVAMRVAFAACSTRACLTRGLRKIRFGIIESTEPESTRNLMLFPRSVT